MPDAVEPRRWNFWAEASLYLGVVPAAAILASGYDFAIGPPEIAVILAVCPVLAILAGWIGRRRTRNGPRESRIVANLGILLGVLSLFHCCSGAPLVISPRGAARRAQSTNNLKQIGLALHNYHQVFDRFPPAVIRSLDGRPLSSWRVAILPYLEAEDLYRQFHLDEPWDSPHNLGLLPRMPSVFASPGDPAPRNRFETPYQAITGPGTAFDLPGGASLGPEPPGDFSDGIDRTLMVASGLRTVPWTKPEDLSIAPAAFGNRLPPLGELGLQERRPFRGSRIDGFQGLFVDGSVRFLRLNLPESVLRALFSRAGGEPVDPNDL